MKTILFAILLTSVLAIELVTIHEDVSEIEEISESQEEPPNGLDSTQHSITPTFSPSHLQEDVNAFGSIKKPPKSRFSSLGRVWTTLTSRRSRESRRVLSDNLPSLPRGRAARINHLAVVADSTQSTVSGQNDDEEVDQEVELARSESSDEEGQGDHAPRSPERRGRLKGYQAMTVLMRW
jgi:hypothetical protein